jgi:hypothetical protein
VAGEAKKLGGAALSAAVPWLAAGGAILLLVYLVKKQLGKGGLSDWLTNLLGFSPPAPVAHQEDTQQDSMGQDHQSGGVGSAAVTGRFLLQDGDTVELTPHLLAFVDSVDIPVSLVNSSTSDQEVLVQIHVYEDFVASDDQQTWEQLVTVNAQASKYLEARINLTAARIPFTRPTLFLDLTVAGVHQARVEGIEVS